MSLSDPQNVIRAAARFAQPRRRKSQGQKSLYELYPLPFFNADARCTWDVKPTGNYRADCEKGQQYAVEFMDSCDGTNGWASLLQCIVADMIRAGPTGAFPDGHPKINGIVIGFMGVIGRAMCASISYTSNIEAK